MIAEEEIILFLESEEDVKKNLQIESEKLLSEIKEIESQRAEIEKDIIETVQSSIRYDTEGGGSSGKKRDLGNVLSMTKKILEEQIDSLTYSYRLNLVRIEKNHRLRLGLAHAYGRTREENNQNTIWAVEKLLGIEKADDGAEIDYYISMDISGINKLNELVGGVTVTIPNDDLLALDPTLKGGETIKLTGMQAEYFTRTRYDTAEPTNEARMARQRIYLNSLETLLEEKIRANVNYVNTLLNEMGMIFDRTTTLDSGFGFTTDDATGTAITDTTDHYLMANVSIDNLALLANRVMDYEVLDVETLNGVHSLGSDEHIHFDLYENEALNWTLKTFYTEAAGN